MTSIRGTGLLLAATLLVAGCSGPAPLPARVPGGSGSVVPGVESFVADPPAAVRGKRVGLITNHTGLDRQGRSTVDLLAAMPSLRLVALFGPEHGFRGTAGPGDKVASGRDSVTGLPVFSLYGATQKPTPEMLAGVDVLVFDIQDVGARQYTYIYTMALAMQAARERGIPFVVLDRPNPIGGVAVEGSTLEPAFATFVGLYPIPSRHGMTPGELAQLFNREFGIGADLHVVPLRGWRRDGTWERTGLRWVAPSPNLPTPQSAVHYPGTVFLEGTNLSEGRGTDFPFEQTGAPWLRADEVVRQMNALALPGVRFESVRIAVRPDARKFGGQTLPGVRLVATDRAAYRPVATSLRLIDVVRRLHPTEFRWAVSHFDRLAGTDRVRRAIEAGTLNAELARWPADQARFEAQRRGSLLY